MNLGALARSLSNSLRFGVGSKKQLETPSQANEAASTSSSRKTELSKSCDNNLRLIAPSSDECSHRQQPFSQTVSQILQKVSELEHTLYEDQQLEFKLRMALERQTERVHELNFSLDTEKERNERLVQLLRGVDTDSCSDSEPEAEGLNALVLHSKGNLFESISPLLMQQRYDELSTSHRQIHRLLAKKDKAMMLLKCDLEELRCKYDAVVNDQRNEERRLEALWTRFQHMQQKKKQQICILKETLGSASECILHAQVAIESCKPRSAIDEKNLRKFNFSLQFFMRELRNCCCQRKLQELQQQQGPDIDVDEELLQQKLNSCPVAPSRSNSSKHNSNRSQRTRHKH
ncbi:uncharacterized protein LOC133843911 [Drosophila sulfurigaster albostrigata]|uniref:uncharacterized protein LOC133843911 n=1 Tax=Drosophila sulfurigaster albostrigata TaxID=89887 RepID=UPI002D21D8B0|nr:uncharacterized protein LOC133843911 [Drosophila sulfurigaster albostrigata]